MRGGWLAACGGGMARRGNGGRRCLRVLALPGVVGLGRMRKNSYICMAGAVRPGVWALAGGCCGLCVT